MVMPNPDAFVVGKNMPPTGRVPAVVLHNPKYAHNVGAVLRLASCYGLKQAWFSGDRVRFDVERRQRIPREERMRGYKDVDLISFDRPFEQFAGAVPVAVEVRKGAESLLEFDHPDNAVYVFGPEDGSLPKNVVQHCHRFLIIPTRHCLNLATAVSAVLWDRRVKRYLNGLPAEVEGTLGEPVGEDDVDAASLGLFDGRRDP